MNGGVRLVDNANSMQLERIAGGGGGSGRAVFAMSNALFRGSDVILTQSNHEVVGAGRARSRANCLTNITESCSRIIMAGRGSARFCGC